MSRFEKDLSGSGGRGPLVLPSHQGGSSGVPVKAAWLPALLHAGVQDDDFENNSKIK